MEIATPGEYFVIDTGWLMDDPQLLHLAGVSGGGDGAAGVSAPVLISLCLIVGTDPVILCLARESSNKSAFP